MYGYGSQVAILSNQEEMSPLDTRYNKCNFRERNHMKGWDDVGNRRCSENPLEKKHHSLFKQPDALAVRFCLGAVRHYVAYYADDTVRHYDDAVHYLRFYTDVSTIAVRRRMGGPVQSKIAHYHCGCHDRGGNAHLGHHVFARLPSRMAAVCYRRGTRTWWRYSNTRCRSDIASNRTSG